MVPEKINCATSSMKLGRRLDQIDKMVIQPYDAIWDCCCDHGQLGIELLKRKAAEKIHFVDIVEPLTAKLEKVLSQFFTAENYKNRWQVHCLDVAKLPLEQTLNATQLSSNNSGNSQPKQLIIIAGVGGELIIEFIQKILQRLKAIQPTQPAQSIEFILCPVHHTYQLRKSLNALNFCLIDESIVTENKRFYEVLHVRYQAPISESGLLAHKNNPQLISSIGEQMWDLSLTKHQSYAKKKVAHYQRMLKSDACKGKERAEIESILTAYQSLISCK
jgi:tRNA (adenine22-N1)-methyltransferase